MAISVKSCNNEKSQGPNVLIPVINHTVRRQLRKNRTKKRTLRSNILLHEKLYNVCILCPVSRLFSSVLSGIASIFQLFFLHLLNCSHCWPMSVWEKLRVAIKAPALSLHAELWPWPYSVISREPLLYKHSLRPYLQTFRSGEHFVSTEFKYSWHSNHSAYWLNVKLTDSYTAFDGTCSIIHLAYWIFPAGQVVWRKVKPLAVFTLPHVSRSTNFTQTAYCECVLPIVSYVVNNAKQISFLFAFKISFCKNWLLNVPKM